MTTITALKARIALAAGKVDSCQGAYELFDTLEEYVKFLELLRLQCRALMGPASADYQAVTQLINKSMVAVIRRDLIGNYLAGQCAEYQ